jgi:hypothetical protein
MWLQNHMQKKFSRVLYGSWIIGRTEKQRLALYVAVGICAEWEIGRKRPMSARWETFSAGKFFVHGWNPRKCGQLLLVVSQ